MARKMQVIVCDSANKAADARQFLMTIGYTDANITTEQAATFVYDARHFTSNPSSTITDNAFNAWVVTAQA